MTIFIVLKNSKTSDRKSKSEEEINKNKENMHTSYNNNVIVCVILIRPLVRDSACMRCMNEREIEIEV